MKKTRWFPGSVKPVRVGVYECRGKWFRYFGESGWYAAAPSPEQAYKRFLIRFPAIMQDNPWRGLSTKPTPNEL